MRVYTALGDQAGLMYQYQELIELLEGEMGIEPLPSTWNLYNRVLTGMEG